MCFLNRLSLILIISFSCEAIAEKSDYDFSHIDRYVEQAKEDIGFPSGTAVAIVKDGKVIYEGYFGYANIKEKKKVTDKTAFYIASITKPMFALSTLLMEKQGDIKDTTSMKAMFPSLNLKHINAEEIQLKHLMSCSAGIVNDPLGSTLAYTGNHDQSQRQKLILASTYNEEKLVGKFNYTNIGFNIVSVWVENFYKKAWQKKLSELIYEPLKMAYTSSYMSDAAKKGFEVARPYALYTKDPSEVYPFEKRDATMHSAGGTIATARDMARFLIAQLNEGVVEGEQIFPAKIIKKSQQQLVESDSKFRDFIRKGYAWGWYLGPYKGKSMHHHFGGTAGIHAHSSFILEHNIGLVVLNNEDVMSSKLTNAIADIAYSVLLRKGNLDDIVVMHSKQMKESWSKVKLKFQSSIDAAEKRYSQRTMELSHAKPKYAGVYYNSLWGELKVKILNSNDFEFTLGQLSTIATAYTKPDTMRVQFPVMGGKVVNYEVDEKGVISLKLFGVSFNKK